MSLEGQPAATDADAPVCYRHPNRTTYISCQRCGRPICPECSTQAAVGVQCPECLAQGQASLPRRAPGFVRALRPSGTPIVTYAIIAICVVLYALQWLTGGALTDAFFLDPAFAAAEPWRLITSAFLHSQSIPVIHLLFNMYALFIFGPPLESFLGRSRFVVLYLVGALGGSVAEIITYQLQVTALGIDPSERVGSLGASGAIFALMGALLVMRKAMGVDLRQILIVVVINLAFGFFVPGIAWQAHLGGFVVGAAIGLVFVRTRARRSRPVQIGLLVGIAVALIAIVVGCVLSAPFFYA